MLSASRMMSESGFVMSLVSQVIYGSCGSVKFFVILTRACLLWPRQMTCRIKCAAARVKHCAVSETDASLWSCPRTMLVRECGVDAEVTCTYRRSLLARVGMSSALSKGLYVMCPSVISKRASQKTMVCGVDEFSWFSLRHGIVSVV